MSLFSLAIPMEDSYEFMVLYVFMLRVVLYCFSGFTFLMEDSINACYLEHFGSVVAKYLCIIC